MLILLCCHSSRYIIGFLADAQVTQSILGRRTETWLALEQRRRVCVASCCVEWLMAPQTNHACFVSPVMVTQTVDPDYCWMSVVMINQWRFTANYGITYHHTTKLKPGLCPSLATWCR